MRHPSVISIDPRGARELDDAIAVQRANSGWKVDVLLPDVPLALFSAADADAAARAAGLTRYSGDAVRHPMLPPEMVEGLSLSPDRDGPAILVSIDVADDLQATVSSVERVVARTAARMTYAEADEAIARTTHPLHAPMASIWDLASRLHADRAAGTGARFDVDAHLFTNEEGQVSRLDDRHAHRSNMAVMEIMILTNAALARHAEASGARILYRNHHLRDMKRGDRASAAAELALAQGIGRREAAARLRAMSHLVGQAELGTVSTGHYGLDLEAYAWFTSPLRRYCDVVNLRALLDGCEDAGIEDLATRLTGLHRQQKDLSSDHHGATSRRRIVDALAEGRHSVVNDVRLHILIRALDENPGFNRREALQHIGRRMAEDGLSGRDIDALDTRIADLFGQEAAETFAKWLNAEPARILLLAEHRGATGETPKVVTADAGDNAKSALYMLADNRRARIVFDEAIRIGPPHNPVFVQVARWIGRDGTHEAEGRGRTKRAAEHNAAAALTARLPHGEMTSPDTNPIDVPARPTAAATTKAPRTELLEIAVARRARVDFGDTVREGADHEHAFTVEAAWTSSDGEVRRTGRGRTKKDAERDVSEQLLAAVR